MAGLTRFSAEEKIRMKRLQVQAVKSCNSIAQAINLDRPSDRPCTARGVRTCLKRMSQPTAKRNYIRKLGPPALLFIDAEVNEDLSLIHISEPTRLLSISYAVFCLK